VKTKRKTGKYVKSSTAGESFQAFVPNPLPVKPALELEGLAAKISEATLALGRLDGQILHLPDIKLFLYFYVRKEALLSSQIEGTQSSFDDLLLYESKEVPGVPDEDVEEVSHYVSAIEHGLKRMEKLPLSLRLLKEIHAILLQGGRGSTKQPGEFRHSQNWIGGSRPGNAMFVPPPPGKVMECMGNLELFLHNKFGKTPPLIKAALAHVQFETIHPFLDGNGRLGRLLITLLLCSENVLNAPILYLSLYFKQYRKTYYELLTRVREDGAWEVWLEFFLDAIIATAKEASESTDKIIKIFSEDKAKIETLGRPRVSAMKVYEYLQEKGKCRIPKLAVALDMSQPTAAASLDHLEKLDIIKEVTGSKRDRMFEYTRYLDVLREGT
jgi:Fic family protein